MQPVNIFEFIRLMVWLKWVFVLIGVSYSLYALLILRQVNLMKSVLDNEENPLVTLLAYGHVLGAIGLTVLAIISP